MSATMTVTRADNTVEHDQPLVLQQAEVKTILWWYDAVQHLYSPAGRELTIVLARKLALSIGEPDRYPLSGHEHDLGEARSMAAAGRPLV